MTTPAVFSPDRKYRYQLTRSTGALEGKGTVNFIMLNPSTADETHDDPSVRRCLNFARTWGYATLIVTNLFAIRATDPKAMLADPEPIGPDNNAWIFASAMEATTVVCAWGAHGTHLSRSTDLRRWVPSRHGPHILQLTAGGEPSHPLYLPGNLRPRLWNERWTATR